MTLFLRSLLQLHRLLLVLLAMLLSNMASKYKCLRPRVIRNSVGNLVSVSCGECEACLTMRSSRNAKLICLESEECEYVEFITLTYSPANLPVASVRVYRDHVYLINETPRLDCCYENNVVGYSDNLSDFSSDKLSFIFNKIYDESAQNPYQYGEGYIPYVSKYDAQCFMKRFRRYVEYHNILKDTNEKKIRYFIASEYGPDRFRPHFHILLFHNSGNLRRRIHRILPKTWPFGNIDCSLSYGETAGYVAGYCNSHSYLPSLYQTRGLRPFCLHSQRLGQKRLFEQLHEVASQGRVKPVCVNVRYGDEIREVFAPISLQNTILPRSFHSVLADDYVSWRLLSLCGRVCGLYNIEEPTAELISSIVKYVDSSLFEDLWRLFYTFGEDFKKKPTEENIDTICRISYNYWRMSRLYPCVDLRKRINGYYKYADYSRLRRQYVSQSEYIATYGVSNLVYLGMYYDNCPIPYGNSGVSAPRYVRPYNIDDYRLGSAFFKSLGLNVQYDEDTSKYSYRNDPDYVKQYRFCKEIFDSKSKVKHFNDRYKHVF